MIPTWPHGHLDRTFDSWHGFDGMENNITLHLSQLTAKSDPAPALRSNMN